MNVNAATSNTCPRCRQTQLFPQGWREAGPNDFPPVGFWTKYNNARIWRCESCDALWSATYDQYGACYDCHPLPKGAERCLHPQATAADVLGLLDMQAVSWPIEAYFSNTSGKLTESAGAIIAAMARETLTHAQVWSLLVSLDKVFCKAWTEANRSASLAPIIELRHVQPLVQLLRTRQLGHDPGNGPAPGGADGVARSILRNILGYSPPVIAIDAASRRQLARLSGIEPVRRSPPKPPEEPDFALGKMVDIKMAPMPPLAADKADASAQAGRGSPQPAAKPANRLLAGLGLLAGSAVLLLTSAFLLGEFLIPGGIFLLSVLLFGALFMAFFALAAWCDTGPRFLIVACGGAVMLGALLLGHYLAYTWDGEQWAVNYYADRAERGQIDFDWRTQPRSVLLDRMLAERLGEASAGGPFDLLRLRAKVGSHMLVSIRWAALPDRGRRDGWQMWGAWLAQAAMAVAAAVAIARLVPRDDDAN